MSVNMALLLGLLRCFFLFKQKTAYEMRISDWSSDGALPISLGAGQSSQRREAGPPAIKGESTWQKAITAPATSWKRKCARKVWASLKTRWLQRLKTNHSPA